MVDKYVKEEYKETIMSDTLKMRILNSCKSLESLDEKHSTNVSKKTRMRIAVATMAAVLVMTLGVSAANNWNYSAAFLRLFGNSIDNVSDIYSYPEVDVISNTFDGLDIEVKGVAATANSLYVLFDITALDGTIFDTTDTHDGGIYVTLLGNKVNFHNPRGASTYDFAIDIEIETRKEMNGIFGFTIFNGGSSVLNIDDDNELDNHMSIAYMETVNLCDYPGSVVVLSINSIKHKDKIIKEGVWKAKFTVPKQQSKVINLDINQKTSMLRNTVFDYTTIDEYIYDEVEINNVTLDALSLQYTYTANENYLRDHTFHSWLKMKDGSTVGYRDITEASFKISLQGSGTQEGNNGIRKIILDEPINPDNVKAICIGTELVIELD